MALKEQLAQWSKALDYWDTNDFFGAYEQFVSFADFAKIHYNVGMCAMRTNNLDEAIAAFSRAITLDEYLSVAYMQIGICQYHMGEFDEALANFEESFKMLRGNFFIDYTQLGMEFQVFACHAIFNIALCHLQRGDTERGVRYISEAIKAVPVDSDFVPDIADIEEAERLGENAADTIMPYEVPPNLVFRPQEDNLRNAERVDYLGQSKVVASVNATDNYTGFSGKLTRDLTLLSRSKKKDANSGAAKEAALKSPASFSAAQTTIAQSNTIRVNRKPSVTSISREPIQEGYEQTITMSRSNSATTSRKYIPRRLSSNNISANTIPGASRVPGTLSRAPSAPLSREGSGSGQQLEFPLRTLRSAGGSSRMGLGDTQNNVDTAAERLNSLTINNNDLPASPAIKLTTSNRSNVSTDSIKVKCHYIESRFIVVPINISFRDLRERVSAKFGVQGLLSLKYKDEEEFMTMMVNDDDLDEAVAVSAQGRLELWCFLLDPPK
ncbi:hypothetical protein BATDEDRAFT_84452 [Batrachochytrium dendrobatidis JAM81]|uniref:PB1 domain-containing protein n=2 Tax=Batrachochytrium dendrobatidis TaxID=109871 RepID=F4NRC5_BATDJ|nr:uncharacterized protein BATDEDRAFT_84452 [Batrachochytrium dendrobatidis JAM81]EGF82929.1 hypothetical protein BATDEDRAFT_84452 [Batrachochytrium dendrobatidis JAM81]OAJ35797.1 hypothetical protein BDEG_20033 [Batrachochytrium dendrobatidis JEL423]|eukprot:XP_006675911.1 hypothetical protein BATDEDRAFT_84452 [Batrachochytrium dendrobatidis JAM81]